MEKKIDKVIKTLNEIIDEGWLISDMEKCTAIDACEMAIGAIETLEKIKELTDKWANELDMQDSGASYMEQIGDLLKKGE